MSGIEALRPAASLEPRSAWDAIAPALFARHNKVEVSPPAWPGVDHALLQHVRPPQVRAVVVSLSEVASNTLYGCECKRMSQPLPRFGDSVLLTP